MKANDNDRGKYSDAIDRIQEGYDAMVELYNDIEPDQPVVWFEDDVLEMMEKAKAKYGAHSVSRKINTVVKEMLSWLDLEDVELENSEDNT